MRLGAIAVLVILGWLLSPRGAAMQIAAARPRQTPAANLGAVAFVRAGDVWVASLADGTERRLTQDGHAHTPRWSPSGEWLSFLDAADGAAGAALWVIRASGADPRRLASLAAAPGPQAAWSPTEDVLAVVADGGLVIARPDGAAPRLLVPAGSGVQDVAWSADGQRLAYARVEVVGSGTPPERGATLEWIAAQGGAATRLLDAGQPSEQGFVVAGWSPDGAQVLYWPMPAFSSSLLADGVPLLAVSVDDGGATAPAEIVPRMLARQDFLAWAPDGTRVALVSGGGRSTWAAKAVVVADGAAPRRLSDQDQAAIFPAWAPDGVWIAFAAGPAAPRTASEADVVAALAQRRIWLVRPDGAEPHPLTADPAYRDERPQWSAAGDWVLFARLGGPGEPPRAGLWLARSDGSSAARVVDNLDLSPDSDGLGYYGLVDWGRLYAWWQPAVAAR
ncbi:MAG TPA: hypothetical protein VII06_20275 [Chloroflexota bacterium]